MVAVATLAALLAPPLARAAPPGTPQAPAGVAQRDSSASKAADTTRRPAPTAASDTSTLARRVARTPAEDSARAESTAVVAERRRSLSIGNIGAAAALLVFGVAAIGFAILLVLAFSRGDSIEVETRWGGIGGSGGGWRLSSSFSYLLAALLFGGLFASTVWALLRVGDSGPSRAAAPATAPRDTTGKR
jgi:hypothetical protein